MEIKEFDYDLPDELIAQFPAEKRENSRLMVLHRDGGEIEQKYFYDILDYLHDGDCLVLNNSKVLPARLIGKKESSGIEVEFLLLKRRDKDLWEVMVRPGRRLKPGEWVVFSENPFLRAEIIDYADDGARLVRFDFDGDFMEVLDKVGRMPLPPYIHRDSLENDKDRYQTVYCKEEGSVAAPTAGLHFTRELLRKAEEKGVKLAYVTLHVGIGTFRPVKCDIIEDHKMHFEEFYIDEKTADLVNETKAKGGRVIAVGTTSTRTLESAAGAGGLIKPGGGSTDIFIYPGYDFKVIDGQITNFHLPKSTLLMLISAFYNREKVLSAYETAVSLGYRFFSYGDAMVIL
jgi:S-adenosylmethionine:tRNA ribosyltransferase-isomerase